MSNSDMKQFLEYLDKKSEKTSQPTKVKAQKSVWNYKQWSQKERDKFLLRKQKKKISKSEKVKRRTEGQTLQINNKKLQKIEIKKTNNYEKNLDFLSQLQEKSKLKKDVYDKIIQNLT